MTHDEAMKLVRVLHAQRRARSKEEPISPKKPSATLAGIAAMAKECVENLGHKTYWTGATGICPNFRIIYDSEFTKQHMLRRHGKVHVFFYIKFCRIKCDIEILSEIQYADPKFPNNIVDYCPDIELFEHMD